MIYSDKEQEIQIRRQSDMQKTDEKRAEFEEDMEGPNLAQATSDCGALLHVIKSSLGGGVLTMPYAFKNAGSAFGIVAALFIGIIVTHATASLVDCSQSLCKIFNKPRMSYADTIEYAFRHGFKGKLKKHAFKARNAVNFFLFLTYYGVLTYYVVMISSTLKQVADKYASVNVDVRLYTVFIIILIFPIGVIKLLKYLVPFSALANTFLVIALGFIFRDMLRGLPPLDSRAAIQPAVKWPIFFATSFTSMEGVGVILPLENEMKNPTHLTRSYRLLYVGMVFSVVVNVLVGFFGYLRYGDDVKGVVSLNLPDDWLSESVKITIALVLLFTYGLQMTAPMKVVWDQVRPYVKQHPARYYYGLRTALIVGNVLVAVALPSVGGIVGLIGSLGFAILGIFLPALIELICLANEDLGCLKWRLLKNLFLMIFSTICAVFGVYSSISEILEES